MPNAQWRRYDQSVCDAHAFTCMRAYICMYMSTWCWTINIASGSAYPFTGARDWTEPTVPTVTQRHLRKFLASDNSTNQTVARISRHRPRKGFSRGSDHRRGNHATISLEPSTLCARHGRPVYSDDAGASRRVRGDDDDRGGAASRPWARSPSCLSPRCRVQQHPQPPLSPSLPRSPDLCTSAPDPHRNHPQF